MIMSYSRWSHSNLYIYWDCGPEDVEQTQDNQILAVWHCDERMHKDFDYIEVKKMHEAKDYSPYFDNMKISVDDVEHIHECVGIWLSEVETDYLDHGYGDKK